MEPRDLPCCEESQVHLDAVEQVRSLLPADETLYDLAELFKIFGDSTRVKILYALLEGELCVCDIAKLMEVTQSAVSHQLRVLKGSKLVKFRREGKTVYYSLADEHVIRILSQGMEHITEQ
ncbi:ArsR family transcriptional regulator [Pseudoflavonifractor sp. AF19-9AC]|uniref:ArsR/SmtB family transcription factor n=1 Tax=Pseudoflavonifractor sp. AF19-9AC TaxID=2292244 RepID=UPI000E4B1255|nr:metalloregulator ArsR/SmtB family transcription factor [Pseudoflavonifractor sp. AF19-9AC]RHR10984.1 ArsR family transcriptional regulator [Pseudoflavonifractor sp. AF19-9AC]